MNKPLELLQRSQRGRSQRGQFIALNPERQTRGTDFILVLDRDSGAWRSQYGYELHPTEFGGWRVMAGANEICEVGSLMEAEQMLMEIVGALSVTECAPT